MKKRWILLALCLLAALFCSVFYSLCCLAAESAAGCGVAAFAVSLLSLFLAGGGSKLDGLRERVAQSMGMDERRVAIAGVIAMEPKVLILDEPTAGLDPEARESLFANIESYRKETGSTVVLVTHSMDDIARIADRLIVMNAGHVVMDGTPEEVFSRAEELEAIGLTVPAPTKIAMELKRMGVPITDAVYTTGFLRKAILKLAGRGE